MIELVVSRHGKTHWNTLHRVQGWLDSDLTEEGIESAIKLRERLTPYVFDAYYSSPSGRALHTMKLASKRNEHEILIDHRLKEISLGHWQGMLVDEIKQQDPIRFDYYMNQPEKFQLEGAEDFNDLYKRVQSFFDDLVARHYREGKKKAVFVVTHGVTLMMMQLIANNDAIRDLKDYNVQSNTTLCHIIYNGEKWSLK